MNEAIKIAIREHGIKQSYVAYKLGRNINTFNNMLNGHLSLKAQDFYRICKITGIPPDYVFKIMDECSDGADKKPV